MTCYPYCFFTWNIESWGMKVGVAEIGQWLQKYGAVWSSLVLISE